MNNSHLLALAGENITAASLNTTSRLRKRYTQEAANALGKIKQQTLKPSQRGVYSMLEQKLRAIDPITVPQITFSGLGDFSEKPSPLKIILLLLAGMWLIKQFKP